VNPAPFPPSSRYHDVETTTFAPPAAEPIVHLRRRLVPPPERFATIQEHVVAEGERPDTLAARFLGDAEQSWRLADANGVLRPEELTETPGRTVRITLPEGIPGPPNA